MKNVHRLSILAASIMASVAVYAEESTVLDTIHVTAEEQVKQSLGVSKITSSDLAKRPVANDVSEILRTMPGVNLTGNSATGQRGNKRQIDLRGMGPENTLILIDGKPVTSRNAERYGVRGERNTRGDSNWVPVEAIESIEVLRGPAAARYGSGAMGGVVNIKTKPASNEFKGSVTYYTNQPEDSQEGATNRVGFNLSGPLIRDVLTFRLYGNYNKTDADAVNINASADARGDNNIAGREGVRNKDIAGRIQWKMSENQKLTLDAGFSRQGNIYNGDTQNSNQYITYDRKTGKPNPTTSTKLLADSNAETARLYRQNYALTYEGKFSHFDNKTYLAWDKTTNSRLPEGLAGGPEGSYTSTTGFTDSVLKNARFSSEFYIPFNLVVDHMLTLGFEGTNSRFSDSHSMTQHLGERYDTVKKTVVRDSSESFPGLSNVREGKASQTEWAVFLEDNIAATDKLILTPAVRYDHHSKSGSNVSGGLNFLYGFTDEWHLKGGIARAYKAPNIYQTNPNYLLYTRGHGCPLTIADVSCYFQGNERLKPETSWNKEIGVEYSNKDGYQASIAYFRNDYRNKIIADERYIGRTSTNNAVFQWSNANRALIEGFEGNLTLPFFNDKLRWVSNFTYMRKSLNRDTGNPLSIVPKYTLNSSLNYQITESFDVVLNYTQYGKQTARKIREIRMENAATLANSTDIGSYAVWGINVGYNWKNTINLRVGVSNLFDKKLYRSNSGASTYNEAGRAYYATLKYSF